MAAGKLIATSPSKERMEKLIQNFWHASRVELTEIVPGEFAVSNARGIVPGFKVVVKKDRYRFEFHG
jgi:hypothetical protein